MIKNSENYFTHFKAVCYDLAPHAKDAATALRPLKAAFPQVLALLQLALTLPVSTASSFCCIQRVRDGKTYIFLMF